MTKELVQHITMEESTCIWVNLKDCSLRSDFTSQLELRLASPWFILLEGTMYMFGVLNANLCAKFDLKWGVNLKKISYYSVSPKNNLRTLIFMLNINCLCNEIK